MIIYDHELRESNYKFDGLLGLVQEYNKLYYIVDVWEIRKHKLLL